MIKSNKSTVWEENYGFANQYRCSLAIYLMKIALLSLHISIYRAIVPMVMY